MPTIGFINGTSGYTDAERTRRASLYAEHMPAGFDVVVESVPNGPTFLDQRADFDVAIDAAHAYFSSLDASHLDLIVWSGAIDPGLAQVRELSSLPVVGPGEAAMYHGSVIGRPLSIVTVDEHAVFMAGVFLEKVTAKPEIASVRSIGVPVRQIMANRELGIEAVKREVAAAVKEDGASVVYLGAMTLGTLGLDAALKESLNVTVLNPIRIAARTAATLVDARVIGSYG